MYYSCHKCGSGFESPVIHFAGDSVLCGECLPVPPDVPLQIPVVPIAAKRSGVTIEITPAKVAGLFVVLVSLFLVAIAISTVLGLIAQENHRHEVFPPQVTAWTTATLHVRHGLKSPRTADFGSILGEYQNPMECVTLFDNDTCLVTGWVDSQNGFGAMIRTEFLVSLRKSGSDSWSLIDRVVYIDR